MLESSATAYGELSVLELMPPKFGELLVYELPWPYTCEAVAAPDDCPPAKYSTRLLPLSVTYSPPLESTASPWGVERVALVGAPEFWLAVLCTMSTCPYTNVAVVWPEGKYSTRLLPARVNARHTAAGDMSVTDKRG